MVIAIDSARPGWTRQAAEAYAAAPMRPPAQDVPDVVAPPPGNPRFPLFDALRAFAALSVVATHTSGRKSMILGNTAHYVKGLDPKESYRILHGLREFATSEPYSYRHKWSVGDTVMWDNRTSLHRATPYDPDCGRMMHRTILAGVEAWEN